MRSWKLSYDGLSAQRLRDDGVTESRMTEAIPADELSVAIPADPIVFIAAMPTVQEQLDALFEGGAAMTAMKAKLAAAKAKQ